MVQIGCKQPSAGSVAIAPAAVFAVCVALLTASSWLGELVKGVSAAQRISWARWVADGMTAVVCVAFIAGHKRVDALFNCDDKCRLKKYVLLLVFIGVASGLGRGLSCFADVLGMPAVLAGMGHVVYEGGLTALLLMTLCMASMCAARWVCLVFPAGFALAAVLHFVLRALPSVGVAAVAPVLPLACAGLNIWVVTVCLGGREGFADEDSICFSGDGRECSKWTFPVRPVLLMCAYAFAFNFSLSLSEGPNPYGMLGMLLVSLIAVAVALGLPSQYNASFLYRMALPLMIAGLVCLAFLGEGRTVAVLFANSGNVAFTLFMYIALATLCARYAVSPAWIFGIVQLASEIAALVGMRVGQEFTAVFPVGSSEANLAVCAMVVAVVVVSTVFFNDEVASRSFGLAPVKDEAAETSGAVGGKVFSNLTMSYSERIVWQCAQVARRYGLTLREQEVLELMVQGMSVPDIAERVSISYGTAKTHVSHIYKKLDVHSRDEALALLYRGV